MEPLAAMGAVVMGETSATALVLYVDPQGNMPNTVQRVTIPKHPCIFSQEKYVQNQWDVYPSHHLVILLIVNNLEI
jgi:hypothetical protein